jgi:hypothetical protein
VPDVSTPVNVITVSDAETLCDNVAVTDTPVSFAAHTPRQISDAPFCAFVRTTRTHVSPAPVTLLTFVLVPPR